MASGRPRITSEWTFIGGFCDVAVSPPLALNGQKHDFMLLDYNSWFEAGAIDSTDEVGPGDDVFMIGRFVDYQGIETTVPAARFGHISMMDVRIDQLTGYRGPSIVLDMHSRSGFSGSPVFVYRTIGSHFMDAPKQGAILTGGGHFMKLLGIHYAQFPEAWEIKQNKIKSPVPHAALKADEHYIEGLSGMTCVIPTSDIKKVLDNPELVQMRKAIETRLVGAAARTRTQED